MPPIIKVTGAVLERKGSIMIAKRKDGSHLAGMWEFPGGKVEIGESPEECLRRELKEEFAILVNVGAHLGSNVYHYDHLSVELFVYRVYWESGDIRVRVHDSVAWVPVQRLTEYRFSPADVYFVDQLTTGRINFL